jgi:hypothetical protein
VELHRDDVVPARGSWWRGGTRSKLPTVGRRRRRMVAVGNEAPVFEWRRELAGKLREDEVELRIGSA